MPGYFKIGVLFKIIGDEDVGAGRGIGHPVTAQAANMIMILRYTVEPFQAAAMLELLNFAAFAKNFKVAIYRSKADARQTFANHFIYLISAGMRVYFAKFFKDDLALPRHSEV